MIKKVPVTTMATRKNSRNAQGSGNIRQRKDKNGKVIGWEARFTVGHDPGSGKQKQRSIYGKTQAEVRDKLTDTLKQIKDGTYKEPDKTTLAQWIPEWQDIYLMEQKPATVYKYKSVCRLHIIPGLGAIQLSALTQRKIQTFISNLNKKGLSPKTIKSIHGVLSKVLADAIPAGFITNNPAYKSVLPRIVKPDIEPLTQAQISAFLSAIKGHTILCDIVFRNEAR